MQATSLVPLEFDEKMPPPPPSTGQEVVAPQEVDDPLPHVSPLQELKNTFNRETIEDVSRYCLSPGLTALRARCSLTLRCLGHICDSIRCVTSAIFSVFVIALQMNSSMTQYYIQRLRDLIGKKCMVNIRHTILTADVDLLGEGETVAKLFDLRKGEQIRDTYK